MDVAVLGAGATGRGIAQCCAAAGHAVTLHDDDANVVMDGIDAVQAGLDDAAAAGELDADARESAVDSIEATTGLDGAVADADIVIETTDADREARRALFADVEEAVDEGTLVATSGSAVSVTAVAAGLRNPGRAVGLQFVDPPAAPLVEVVVAEQTAEPTRDAAVSFVDGLNRESIVVRDTPGAAATRLGLALAAEAVTMVDERAAGVAAIDRATTAGHDHPVGPLAAADERGLDATLEALEHLRSALGERFAPPPVLREKVEAGDLGRKTGEGFYVWEGDDPVEPSEPDPTPELRAESPVDPDDQPAPGGADGGEPSGGEPDGSGAGGEGPEDGPGNEFDDFGGPVGPGDG
ncbi:3-hydroxyacyl-CoA dehydrogenase family protein [Halosimplex litoreum]|uniref:3-hydroxyacyl-CoA dehydrogenase family protein n=1 Tax=Halosimplex litoreum TaxID=1198301 RepID=A0A7T3KUD3_9EURY|nr:3-hydroxyacyl-CoA dehydrogenase family protein [Halosimplex litoreum]QPV62127.1 3-hydroxyacyl-CoA dehydrogenase family protein [Halosimplex litoreum]